MDIIPSAANLVPPPSGRPPVINLVPRDSEALADDLLAYHAHFAPLFQREEQRQWALAYLQGQLLDLDRTSIEPMALALPDGNVQASVVAWYASQRGYTLLDRRLYMPEKWFTPAYQRRRERCGVPTDLTFQTQSELAWALIQTLHTRQVVPFAWVIGDEHFGHNPVLLDRIAAAQLCYLLEVPHDTRVWRERPVTAVPPPRNKQGRQQQRPRLVADAPAPTRVDGVATDPALRWR